tara:strand:- start:108 stop:368 length:261 start_codon:yes stop_codon:yes gene_type:complete
MKLKDIFTIQKHFDRKKTPCDIIKVLDQSYYSKSKDKNINYADMHIAHYIRVTQKTIKYQALEIKELKKQLNQLNQIKGLLNEIHI